ncbi:hypothetical protein P691DRAFT_291406 [Macrolepiota fuliginosa MF-IS2]|uniref:Uncharacterized protein n=1 Tax=Macrolepiota fuliginosa MF-IS2 TaxID=1400762 RepID=A0A9P5X5A8_9AGAR|nr:hypothetical protein P691DRAFT_291406 [Macrolepiota fuliginosa MF-IS2]
MVPYPINERRDNGTPPSTATSLRYRPEEPNFVVSRRTRVMLYLRFLIFVLIEVTFIGLAAICLTKPILLNTTLALMSSEVKGGFTVLFIVWQGLATVAGGYILADAFSREWSVHLEQIVPGTTDRVSTITSGFLDRFLYFFTKRASGTFKLTFLASLSFMALTQLAPGTITATTTLIYVPTRATVGSLVTNLIDIEFLEDLAVTTDRASLIIRLEQIERSPFGLDLPPNRLVALPSVNLTDLSDGVLEYDSDVVDFHHDCHWEAPSFVNITGIGMLVIAAGRQWSTTLAFGTANATTGKISNFPLCE